MIGSRVSFRRFFLFLLVALLPLKPAAAQTCDAQANTAPGTRPSYA
jgi:hypothetical protein